VRPQLPVTHNFAFLQHTPSKSLLVEIIHTTNLRTAHLSSCQDPASTSPLGSTGNIGGAVAHGVLLTLPAYSHFGRPHTPLRGLVVLVVSITPGVVASRLFSHAFAWARCSRGIRHVRRGLFTALLTHLCMGSLFSRYPSRPAWSLRGSSHTPLRGLVVLVVVVAALVTGIER